MENRKVSDQESRDELCGVLDRRAGRARLSQAVASVRKSEKALLVAMLDVNNLKKINDGFGRREGDFLLTKIVEVFRTRIVPPDFIFRVGGDEFVLVLHEMTEKDASLFLLNCLHETEGLQEQLQKPYEFSFCYGFCLAAQGSTLTANELIAKADEQMYLQKLRYRKTKLLEETEKNPFRRSSKEAEAFSYDSSQLYDALIKSTDEFVYICNMKTGVFRYSPAQVELFGLPGEIIENPLPFWKSIVHPDDWERFYKSNMEIGENQMDYHSVEFRAKNKKGEYLWLKCRGQLMRDEFGEPSVFAGIMTQLDRQNKIDPLTQLLNRQEFVESCERKLVDMAIDRLGIMILDIDDFHLVNELYDREFGDFVLKTLAQFIQSILPGNARMYRLEKDRMGMLVENVSAGEVEDLYHMIQDRLIRERIWPKSKYQPQLSAGCAMYPADGQKYQELYKYAEYSLQYAKLHGKHRYIQFSVEILGNKLRSLEIMRQLRASVENDYEGFSVVYQPQVDALTRKIKGAEALLRWNSRDLGNVSPEEYVPILEEDELILPVGLWVLRKALRACKKWLAVCPAFSVSVNVSALQLREESFLNHVLQILCEEQFPGGNLILEVTESYAVQNMQFIKKIFETLRTRGVRIAMDDFGTGYSSLGVLKQAPVDVVKIDRAFVKDILDSRFDATFIRFVVAICHDVGIEVCLEGVETEEEYQIVKKMQLDDIQGYLFGKPVEEEALTARLAEDVSKNISEKGIPTV